MKFLCPKCKAKYQIADDKLQGRAVRMKCRKCGHVIKVPARVRAKKDAPDKRKSLPKSSAARPSVGTPPPRPPRPSPAPRISRPSSSAGRAHQSSTAPVRPVAPKSPAVHKPSQPDAAEGLHGAFVKKAKESVPPVPLGDEAPVQVLSAGATEEWYVGINGVPVGPVRMSTLRQKATAGAIDGESLVWREGFEEWLPLKTFPELAALVAEAKAAGGRPSFAPGTGLGGSGASPHPGQADVSAASSMAANATNALASSPYPGLAGVSGSSPGPVFGSSSSTELDDELDGEDAATIIAPGGAAALLAGTSSLSSPSAPGQVLGDPFASPPPGGVGQAAGVSGGGPAPEAVVKVGGDEGDADADAEGGSGERQSLVDEIAFGVRRQARLHPAAYVLIALALGFGVTAAVVLLGNDDKGGPAPPPTQLVIVKTVQAPTEPGNVASPAQSEGVAKASVHKGSGGRRVAHNGHSSAGGGAKGTEPEKGSSDMPHHQVGLGAGPSINGPSVGGPTGGGAENLPSELSQGDIQRVVASQQALVKRRCWERALATRSRGAPKSAKVTVSLTIGPSGRVSGASASGGNGYPGLASCIQSRVRHWTFPRSAGTSRAVIPFVFVSQ